MGIELGQSTEDTLRWKFGFRKREALVKIIGVDSAHDGKRLSVSGPPSEQPFQTRMPLKPRCRRPQQGLDVKSQSLFDFEFDNLGFPRQPRSRGDQVLLLPLSGNRINRS